MDERYRHIDKLITKYLDGSVSQEEYSELRRYLMESRENFTHFIEIRDLWLYSAAIWQPVKYTLLAFEKLKGHIEKFLLFSRIKKTVYYVSQVAAIIVAAVIFLHLKEQEIGPAPDISTHTVLSSVQKSKVILPDGTVVWLNDSSKLVYPGQFSSTCRQVYLEGEAYFNVVHDKTKPFIVKSDGQEIKVLGTSFNVCNRPEEDRSVTTLVSGSVSLHFNNDTLHPVILTPNEKITYSKSLRTFCKDTVLAREDIVWATEKMVFNNDKFIDVISYLEKRYQVQVTCPAEIADTLRLTLVVRNEPKEEIFKEIARIAHLQYYIHEESVHLSLLEEY